MIRDITTMPEQCRQVLSGRQIWICFIQRRRHLKRPVTAGLFQFLRYIERLKKYEVDFAEASVLGENENLVRVMSIHKSKGLEFPVVILADTARRFNLRDTSNPVLFHPSLGAGHEPRGADGDGGLYSTVPHRACVWRSAARPSAKKCASCM